MRGSRRRAFSAGLRREAADWRDYHHHRGWNYLGEVISFSGPLVVTFLSGVVVGWRFL